ncbi:MAG: response regulator [Bacteroidetes bacterium]|nr:response regulator [Bacteroidota bacterium]
MTNKWQKEASKTLIIEDCIRSTVTIKDILKDSGQSVISSCGEQGIKVAMDENPNIILLEIVLKRRNGLQILYQLKNNARTKHIPVLIVTKLNTQQYWDESYSLGADGYLVKPDHYPWLIKRINSIIK